MLSFGEILLILLVAILILKPEDLQSIMKYFLKLKKQILEIKEYFGKVFREIEEKTLNKDLNKDEINEMNSYVKKIQELGLTYDGEYNTEDLRKYYLSAIKKIKEDDDKKERR
jgi:Sec-independent protein translocase protein TatA